MKFHKPGNIGYFFWCAMIVLSIGLGNYLAIGISVCAFMQFVLFVNLLDEADETIDDMQANIDLWLADENERLQTMNNKDYKRWMIP